MITKHDINNGSFDNTFGNNGVCHIPHTTSSQLGLHIYNNNLFVSYHISGQLAVAKVNSQGILDQNYGGLNVDRFEFGDPNVSERYVDSDVLQNTLYIMAERTQNNQLIVAAVNLATPQGQLVSSFNGGITTVNIPNSTQVYPSSLSVTSNGIFLVGEVYDNSNQGNIFVVKINPSNGNPYPNFAINGIFRQNLLQGDTPEIPQDCTVDSQGRIYVVGTLDTDTSSQLKHDGFLIRLTPTGVLDISIAPNGVYRIKDVKGPNAYDRLYSIFIMGNSIFVTGYSAISSDADSITIRLD
ncbi:MAG: hypothetical protein ABDH21_02345 [bacterium]